MLYLPSEKHDGVLIIYVTGIERDSRAAFRGGKAALFLCKKVLVK